MKSTFRAFLFVLIFVGASTMTVGALTPEEQRIVELQGEIERLEREAAKYRNNVAEERAKADSLRKEIAILQNQIGQINAQINATNVKIDKTQTEIGQIKEDLELTQNNISRKRATVGRMILFLEQQDHEDLVASLLKHTDLSDFLQQFHDLAVIKEKLLEAIDGLKTTKAVLEEQEAILYGKQSELEELNAEAEQRKSQLSGVTYEKDRVLRVTKGQEAAYQARLKEIEEKKAAFFKELRELELKVVSGGLQIVHIKADTLPPKGTKLFVWPEDNYYLTQGYGYTSYAKRGAYGGAPHNGIDIAAGYGTPIKSIGDGLVVANGTNDGWGNWVAIQHPSNLVSLYAHMSSFNKKVGTQVSAGEVIGYEGTTGNVTGSHLHLSLYREFFTYLKGDELYFNYFDGTVNPRDYM